MDNIDPVNSKTVIIFNLLFQIKGSRNEPLVGKGGEQKFDVGGGVAGWGESKVGARNFSRWGRMRKFSASGEGLSPSPIQYKKPCMRGGSKIIIGWGAPLMPPQLWDSLKSYSHKLLKHILNNSSLRWPFHLIQTIYVSFLMIQGTLLRVIFSK